MARLQDMQTVTPTSSDKLLVVQSQGQGLASWGSKMDSANPTGTGSLSLNRKANTTTGNYSVAEGRDCEASNSYTRASGYQAVASGFAAQAEGVSTIADRRSQHAFGEYNIADTQGSSVDVRGKYVEVVGNGSSTTRSNARTLDWSGNEVLAGNLTVNGSDNVATDKWIKIVSGSKSVISSGTLTAGSYGYLEVSVVIPSGYVSTGLAAFAFGHPANAGGLSLTGTLQKGQTGTKTMYISYYTPRDIASGSTDFIWNVECIKTDANINP